MLKNKRSCYWNFRLNISMFLYKLNAYRKILRSFFSKKDRKFKIDGAFRNIKNFKRIFATLESWSIYNFNIVLINKLPPLFLRSEKYFVKVLPTLEDAQNCQIASYNLVSALYEKNPKYFPRPIKCFKDKDLIYVITENICDTRLDKKGLRKISKLDIATKRDLLKQLKDIVTLLCELKIVHTDIYWHNVLFDEKNMRLVLIDFDGSRCVANSAEIPESHRAKLKERLELDVIHLCEIFTFIAGDDAENLELKDECISLVYGTYQKLLK